jgi:hypothetical protein
MKKNINNKKKLLNKIILQVKNNLKKYIKKMKN